VTYFPPTQGPGRPFGEPTPRLTEQEFREQAQSHDRQTVWREHPGSWWRRFLGRRRKNRGAEAARRTGFLSRLFRKRSATE
jgi:hypothetical protein